jgi:hypothetical protein
MLYKQKNFFYLVKEAFLRRYFVVRIQGHFMTNMENPGRKILICDKLNLRNSEKAISKPNIETETVGVRPIACEW